jgi:hypothetical protein
LKLTIQWQVNHNSDRFPVNEEVTANTACSLRRQIR